MIPRFQADAGDQQCADALATMGAVIVESLLDEALIDAFTADIQPTFDEQGYLFKNEFNGYQTHRIGGVANHSQYFAEILANAKVLAVAEAILRPHCECIQVGSTTAIEILPGEKAQVLHRDDSIYPIDLLPFELQVSALWALDDFTEENGATRVVAGTDRVTDATTGEAWHTDSAIMPKGSLVMYLGSTLHGGGANHSSQHRRAVVNTYCLGWLRQEENQYLTLPQAVVGQQSEAVRRLLGFQSHGTGLGLWPQDPDDLWFDS